MPAWHRLARPESRELIEATDALAASGVTPAGIMALRRRFVGEPVAEALELSQARTRASVKFPRFERMLMDRAGLEQATAFAVAVWKAHRFAARPVLDLCSGIGGDAMGLAARGVCVSVDRDPVRAFMTAHNAGVETRVAAVEDVAIDLPLVHLDPARRDEASGRRSWRSEDLQPDLETIRGVLASADGGAVKLGPGFPALETRLHARQSVSVIAFHTRLVQAVVWTGTLAIEDSAQAVDLPSGEVFAGVPRPLSARDDSVAVGEVLVEFHPAVERLGLSGTLIHAHGDSLDWAEPARGLGLATGAAPSGGVPARIGRWCRVHRVCEVAPARIEEVEAAIAAVPEAETRRVVVRTRDGAIDADAWTRRLNSSAVADDREAIVVFGLRLGRRKVAVVCLGEEEATS